jgi:hypothetical protein
MYQRHFDFEELTPKDYQFLVKCDLWTLSDAIFSLVGLKVKGDNDCLPDIEQYIKDISSIRSEDDLRNKFNEVLEIISLIHQSIEAGTLNLFPEDIDPWNYYMNGNGSVKPATFIQWALTKGFPIPEPLECITRTCSPNEDSKPVIAVIERDAENRLYSVLAQFRDNLTTCCQSSLEIFRTNYTDPSGSEYWRGWLDMPILSVVHLSDLLAIHKANEEADTNAEGFTLRYNDEGKPFHVSLSVATQQKYDAARRKVLEALRAAAKGEASFFRGDNALLREMNDGELFQGWKYGPLPTYQTRPLTDVNLNPREAFEWFASKSIYADRLPKSLNDWLVARSTVSQQEQEQSSEFIGQNAIIEQFKKRFSINTWTGIRNFLKRNNFTLRYIPRGKKPKPVISEEELIDLGKRNAGKF